MVEILIVTIIFGGIVAYIVRTFEREITRVESIIKHQANYIQGRNSDGQ